MFFIKKTIKLKFLIIKTTGYNYTPEILGRPYHFRLTCTAGKSADFWFSKALGSEVQNSKFQVSRVTSV